MVTRVRVLLALAFGAGLLAEPLDAQPRIELSQPAVAAIGQASDAFGRAVVARDWKAVVALYTDDAVLYPPGETAVKGRASIEACLSAFPPLVDFSLRVTRAEGHEDLAYVQGAFTMTIGRPESAQREQVSGYFLEVLRKQPDGRWLIAVQMLTPHA